METIVKAIVIAVAVAIALAAGALRLTLKTRSTSAAFRFRNRFVGNRRHFHCLPLHKPHHRPCERANDLRLQARPYLAATSNSGDGS